MNIIIATGAESYTDQLAVNNALNDAKKNLPELAIIEGGSHNGADWLIRKWALSNEMPCFTCKAPTMTMGTKAIPARNTWMLKFMRPNYLVVFGDDPSVQDIVEKATALGIPVWKL